MSVGMQNNVTYNTTEKQYSLGCREFQTTGLWDRLEGEVKEHSK